MESATLLSTSVIDTAQIKWAFVTWDTGKCPVSVLDGLFLEKVYELLVGTNATARY